MNDITINDTIEGERMEDRAFAVRGAFTSAGRLFQELHQTHEAQAWRDLGAKAVEQAQRLVERNDRDGVPD